MKEQGRVTDHRHTNDNDNKQTLPRQTLNGHNCV
jgi:hypothetical protein